MIKQFSEPEVHSNNEENEAEADTVEYEVFEGQTTFEDFWGETFEDDDGTSSILEKYICDHHFLHFYQPH